MITKNIPYKSGPLSPGETEFCQLDIYAPDGASNLPVFVWLHGGGLFGGDRNADWFESLAVEGFVVASANYRLSPAHKFPSYVEDAAAAVAWMRAHAHDYGGSRTTFIAGHSAGGYLAALLSTDARYLGAHGIKPSDIAGVISLSGQLITHYTVRAERGVPATAIRVDEAAPLYHAGRETPPTLLAYGDNDMSMRAEEAELFAAALRNAGQTRVVCLKIAERDHQVIAGMGNSDDPLRREIVAFLREQSGS